MKSMVEVFVFICLAGLNACASKSNSGGVGTLGTQAASTSQIPRGPSPIDPAKSPVVNISGIADGDLIVGSSVKFKVAITNYPMESGWQEGRVVLNHALVERLSNTSSSIELSSGLKEGLNRITVYLARSFNESIKAPGSFSSVQFFFKKKEASVGSGTSAGLLLVSPELSYKAEGARKIPFDFFVTHSQGRRYRVYYTLDGATREVSAEGAPYYFYNLAPGNHNLLVELIDTKGKPVKSAFGKTETQFRIE